MIDMDIKMTSKDAKEAKNNTVLFILPHKFQKKRLNDMKLSMTSKYIPFVNILDSKVTHIVTECVNYDQVIKFMEADKLDVPEKALVVSTAWLVECLKNSQVMPVLDSHMIKKVEKSETLIVNTVENPEWACERGAKLTHHNEKFTEALELLQSHAELRNETSDYSRALAFRRASCVLKSLPFTLTDVQQLIGWKDIGEHVQRVLADVLDYGSSPEVEEIRHSDWFSKMKLFTDVFGVGPATAKSWIDKGLKSLEDVRKSDSIHKDWRITWGLAFYKDLACPVNLQEVEAFETFLSEELHKISPLIILTVTGGFRRGKQTGHDIDILITHPQEGAEVTILSKLLEALNKKDFILKGQIMKNTFSSEILHEDRKTNLRSHFDHFEKWLGICKFPKSFGNNNNSGLVHGNLVGKSSESTKSVEDLLQPTDALLFHDVAAFESKLKRTIVENVENKFHCSNVDQENEVHIGLSANKKSRTDNDDGGVKGKKCKYEDLGEVEINSLAGRDRDWTARRVDLIIAPYSQYFYALVGWTGSKHFNRDARLYAQKALGFKLTSHGLYDMKKHKALSAYSEEDVFSHLKLPFLDPTERNC